MMVVMRSRHVLLILAALLFIFLSCSSGSGFQVLKNELTTRQFPGNSPQTRSMAAVTGNAVNPGQSTVTNCLITVTFYDDARNTLGVATATKDSLRPGEVWNFSVQINGPDAWKARSYDIVPSSR